MKIVTIDAKDYDLDAVSPEVRKHIEQLQFLASDVAKLLVPAAELPAKVETSKKALAQALAAAQQPIFDCGTEDYETKPFVSER